MVVKLRSSRLALLFSEVWERLPEKDSHTLSNQALLIVDDSIFLPKGQAPYGAVISVSVKKTILIVYLSQRKLPKKSDCFIKQVITDLLGSITGDHYE